MVRCIDKQSDGDSEEALRQILDSRESTKVVLKVVTCLRPSLTQSTT